MALARSQRWRGTSIGKSVRVPALLSGLVKELSTATPDQQPRAEDAGGTEDDDEGHRRAAIE